MTAQQSGYAWPAHPPAVASATELARRMQQVVAGSPYRMTQTPTGFAVTAYPPDAAGTGGCRRQAVVTHHVYVDERAGRLSVTDEVHRAAAAATGGEQVSFGVTWSTGRMKKKSLRLTPGHSGAQATPVDPPSGRQLILDTARSLGWRTGAIAPTGGTGRSRKPGFAAVLGLAGAVLLAGSAFVLVLTLLH